MVKEVSMYAVHDAHIVANIVPKFEWIRADALKSPEYQRVLQPTWARRIAREFDPDKLWPLIVSRRADGDYVLDGQHRLYAIRDVLNWGDQNVPCLVYTGLSPALETKLFNTQTAKGRKSVTALDELHADYVGGQGEAVMVVTTVERARLRLDWSSGGSEGTVRAAQSLRAIYRAHGAARLLETLALLRDTFGLEARVFQNGMLVGMAAFLLRYGEHEHYSRAEFERKLGRIGLDEVLRRGAALAVSAGGSGRNGGTVSCGRAMLLIYNAGRKTRRLPDWEENVRAPEAEQRRAERIGEYPRTYPRVASSEEVTPLATSPRMA